GIFSFMAYPARRPMVAQRPSGLGCGVVCYHRHVMASTVAAPRHWPPRLGFGPLWTAARLPVRMQFWLGRLIGRLGYRFARHRRHIAATNIALCLPELDAVQRAELLRANFVATGIGAVETAIAWFGDLERYRPRFKVEGLELLTNA